MSNLQKLLDEKRELNKQLLELTEKVVFEKRNFSTEEEQTYKDGRSKESYLEEQIKKAEATERRIAAGLPVGLVLEPGVHRGDGSGIIERGQPLEGELRILEPKESLADEIRSAPLPGGVRAADLNLGRYIRGIYTGDWSGAEAERLVTQESRALAVGSDILGGYLVPSPLSAQLIDLARNRARVIQAGARTVPMDSNTLTFAKLTGAPTAAWTGEAATIAASDHAFGKVELQAKKLAARTIVSVELMEDGQNASPILMDSMAESLALALDLAALRGAGTGIEPLGISNVSGVGNVAGGSAAVTHAMFSNAVQDVQVANGPERLSAIYTPGIAGTLDRLQDTANQPLKPPQSFVDLRKLISTQIPTTLGGSSDETEIYVGDFSQCYIGMRTALQLEVSREASFDTGQVQIRAYLRADVAVVRPAWFSIITAVLA